MYVPGIHHNVMKDLRGKCFKYECTEYCMHTFKMVSQSCWPSKMYKCMYVYMYVCSVYFKWYPELMVPLGLNLNTILLLYVMYE